MKYTIITPLFSVNLVEFTILWYIYRKHQKHHETHQEVHQRTPHGKTVDVVKQN